MRYFLAIFAVCVFGTVGILGFRGSHFRKPPLYIFPDMERQPKPRPQTANGFFENGMSSRQPVAGTVARSQPIQVGSQTVYAWQDTPVTTGLVAGREHGSPVVRSKIAPCRTHSISRSSAKTSPSDNEKSS